MNKCKDVRKTAVITGASRGIGLAIANKFRSEGFEVYGMCRTQEALEESSKLDFSMNKFDFLLEADVIDAQRFVEKVNPSVLINNAGINKISPFLEISLDDFTDVQRVNLMAPFLMSQSAVRGMLGFGYGRIVNIASIWGIISKAGRASYSASKHGIHGLSLALAAEFSEANILINSVSPGFVDTDLTRTSLSPREIEVLCATVPANRLAVPDEIADLVFFLGSHQNTFIAGQNIACDGGFCGI
jgi:NAD(P)-dependent dehydrogenase (short-subunit alcohol dehydrogenase family)